MGQRLGWFFMGFLVASALWLTFVATVDAQLLRTFLGFGGT